MSKRNFTAAAVDVIETDDELAAEQVDFDFSEPDNEPAEESDDSSAAIEPESDSGDDEQPSTEPSDDDEEEPTAAEPAPVQTADERAAEAYDSAYQALLVGSTADMLDKVSLIAVFSAAPKPTALLDQLHQERINGLFLPESEVQVADKARIAGELVSLYGAIKPELPQRGSVAKFIDPRELAIATVKRSVAVYSFLDALRADADKLVVSAVETLGEDFDLESTLAEVTSENELLTKVSSQVTSFLQGKSAKAGKSGSKAGTSPLSNEERAARLVNEGYVTGARKVHGDQVLDIREDGWYVSVDKGSSFEKLDTDSPTPSGAAVFAERKRGIKQPSVNGWMHWKNQ